MRAYDARTGALKWSWDPVPQDPADPAYREWRGAMAHKTGAANAWSVLAADPERDLVFVPTGSAAPDYYGALRLGDNRYANSIVALRASTGEVGWAFQTVHHDLWDYDNASPPALVTLHARRRARARRAAGDEERNAVRARSRDRHARLPGRGAPGAGERHPARGSRAHAAVHRGHAAAEPAPLHAWMTSGATTDADREACRAAIEGLRNEGIFTPPSVQGTLVLPSNIGGAHWGGVAVDPERQIAVVPVNRIAAMVQLIPREGFDLKRAREGRSSASETITSTT